MLRQSESLSAEGVFVSCGLRRIHCFIQYQYRLRETYTDHTILIMSITLRDGDYRVTDGYLPLIRVEGCKGHYKDPRTGEMKEIQIEYGQVVGSESQLLLRAILYLVWRG